MKKILFSIALLSAGMLLSAQAVLEHSYSTDEWNYDFTNTFNTESGIHYFTTENSVMRIYDSNHSLIKSVNLPIGLNEYGIVAVSDKLFNSDNLIEFILWTRGEFNSGYTYSHKLLNENGEIVQDLLYSENGMDNEIHIVKGIDNDYKLIIAIGQYDAGFDYNIYSLPGTYLEVNTLMADDKAYIYPNPAKTVINLTNPNNGSNELKIFSSAGHLVKFINFGNEEKITVNVNELPKGVYIIKAGNLSSKFIKD